MEDHPRTCTMNYSVIEPGKTSAHHMHPWEHEVYILEGSGVLVCDGKEYPVKEGDAMLVPGNVDHYTLNNRSSGVVRRIEVNPLTASQTSGGRTQGGKGSGQPPIIRNYRDIDLKVGNRLLSSKDHVPNYGMQYGVFPPGSVSHRETAGHNHRWEHLMYILQGSATLVCDGKSHTVSEGDAVLVPSNAKHQWRNETRSPMLRVTFNAISAETHEG